MKPAKQQSRNQRKKTNNENSNTVCIHKTATTGEKTQGKKQTTGKNYFERKIIFAQTLKAQKGARTAKQHNEANLGNSPSAQAGQNIFFGFSLKKKTRTNHFFLKQNSEHFYWSRNVTEFRFCFFIGPSIMHERIRGSEIGHVTPTTCVS